MKRLPTTDHLLTLGMALTSDRRTMERRVRGVFARRKSAKGMLVLSIVLALALGVGAFTTACQPEESSLILTPIPVEQTAAADEQKSGMPQGKSASTRPVSAKTLWNPAKELLDSASALPGAAPASVTHVAQAPETLPAGITVLVDADVVIPQVEGYRIQEWNKTSFTLDEYRFMINYFMPNAKWVPNQKTPGFQTNGAFDLEEIDMEDGTTFTAEQDGEMLSVDLGGEIATFRFGRAGEGVLREGYLVGDEEWEQEVGEIIRAPIAVKLETAQAQAERVIADLHIQDWQIDSVQRAVAMDRNDARKVLSHGWLFVYGLSNAGLSMRQFSGDPNNSNDRLSYWKANAGTLTIYVNERGVSEFRWEKGYEASSVKYSIASIISAEEALELAKERIARIYGELAIDDMQIEIYDIRLSAMLIGYSDQLTGQPFPEVYEQIALLIPTWNIAYREIYPSGDTEYFIMPFCAVDGGAVSMQFH